MGRYAIVNLSRYLVFAQIIGLVMAMAVPQVLSYMTFSGYDILHGQIWRLVSWIFIPTASLDIFGLLFLFCVFMWGNQLESLIGTFRLNLFVWGGVLWCDIAGMIAYVLLRLIFHVNVSPNFTPYYILMSMLLAIAICLPDAEVRLYFVLPIKMKWMLVFELIYVGYAVVMCYVSGFQAYGSSGAGDNCWHLLLEHCKACRSLFRCCICSGFSMQSRCAFPESRENASNSSVPRCPHHVRVPESPCTNAQSADVQRLQTRSWNSAIAANASAIGNTVRIICLRISMCDNDYKIF